MWAGASEPPRESPGRRRGSKNFTAVSKLRCGLRAISARNHFGAAVVVPLPRKSDYYPSVCLFGIDGHLHILCGIEPARVGHSDRSKTQGHESVFALQRMLVWALAAGGYSLVGLSELCKKAVVLSPAQIAVTLYCLRNLISLLVAPPQTGNSGSLLHRR